MKRRIAIFAAILVILMLVGTEVVGVASANPFGLAKQMDAPSDAKPPIISIVSPENNTIYSGSFNISFSVQEPQYFSRTAITNAWYTIDNQTVSIPPPYPQWILTQGPGASQYCTSIIAPTLSAGNHSLKIRAQGGSYDFYNFFLIDGYSQVYFTVSDNSPQTNHSNKTNTLGPALDDDTAMPTTQLAVIIGLIVIVAVACISLVYFKRRKPKPA
jgi:hypothetical protein